MYTKLFWKDAVERAIKTFAQTFIGVAGYTGVTTDLSLLEINYIPLVIVSFITAGLSILTSVASAAKAGTDTASLTVDTKELK